MSAYRRKKEKEEKAVCRDIRQYGHDVLRTDAFRSAFGERHHLKSSVADHSLSVCITSVQISRFLKKLGVSIDEKDLVQAALLHDLGMLGRRDKYHGPLDAWRSHADESIRIAKTVLPELDHKTEDMIRSHMWPVAGKTRPSTREEMILTIADKYASLTDWAFLLSDRTYKTGMKKKILPGKYGRPAGRSGK
ncbi:MAG: HD domain-containing protein [Lachnospiraceae bacterium]|nr:HD domain-containing protein [Lachnospiraceae bacterium]